MNDAMRSFAYDLNLAWVGAFPGVRVRTINLLAFCSSSEIWVVISLEAHFLCMKFWIGYTP